MSNDAEFAKSDAEARNHSSADSVQWQRKGVPLHIVQSQGPMERTLTDLVALAKVLYQEEQKAFQSAMAEAADRSVACTSQQASHGCMQAPKASAQQHVLCLIDTFK